MRQPREDKFMEIEEMWNTLKIQYGVSEETLQVVTDINGYSKEVMLDILYSVSGLHEFE